MTAVRIEDVQVELDGSGTILHGVDLDVADGEFVTIVGPSGSGKTTLLRTVAGFVAPRSGRVLIGGEIVSDPSAQQAVERRGLGMVFQQHALWPHMTVGENVAYPLRMAGAGQAERRRRVSEALALVGLPDAESSAVDRLSGGQRQRVALARAVVGRPRLLLLDEALSALDEPLRAELRGELRAMSRRLGLTVLHVTHDRAEALAIADRVVVLEGGQLRQAAAPEEIMARPASPFVASFLGDAGVIEGRIAPSSVPRSAPRPADASGAEEPVFQADALPLQVPVGEMTVCGGTPGSGGTGSATIPEGTACVLAVPPHHLRLQALPVPGAEEADPRAVGQATSPARVVASLYGRHAHRIELDWGGRAFHADVQGRRPEIGQSMQVEVTGGFLYPAG